MKDSKVLRVAGIIVVVAMLVFAILYYTNVWQGAYDIHMLLWGVLSFIESVKRWNEKRGWAITFLCLGVVMIGVVIAKVFII